MKENEGKVKGGEIAFVKRIIKEYFSEFSNNIKILTF